MDYTQMLGNTNELKCLLAFMQLGYECSIPYGNGAKYDFIVDVENCLYKIQCKSSHYVRTQGKITTDAIQFSTICQTTNTKETVRHKYTEEEIDYFATSFDDKVYVVPAAECSTNKTLRFNPPSTNQKNYNKAEDYLLEKVFKKSQKLQESKEEFETRQEQQVKQIKHFYCPECGAEVSKEGNKCWDCYMKERQNPNLPTREVLKELIKTDSFVSIGKQFGVSDNMVRKWCKKYNLPFTKTEIKRYSEEDWINI